MGRKQQLPTFQDALAQSVKGKKSLLLGNGFSMAWKSSAFSYGSLRKKADLSGLSCDGKELFDALDTNDFEVVIERLGAMDRLLGVYDPRSTLTTRVAKDASVIRDALAKALAANHPDNVSSIPDHQYVASRKFLKPFDCIYSVNYDLLLYWSTLQTGVDSLKVAGDDGFRSDPDDPDAEWVTWDNIGTRRSQTVHYLHGALHLFDAGDRLKKLTWIRTSVPLLDQIRKALRQSSYPLVVTEGSSAQKIAKIEHSAYLSGSYRSLGNIGGHLLAFGHGFGQNDEHILEAIVRSNVLRLSVSLHGNPSSKRNQQLQRRAKQLAELRHIRTDGKKPLDIDFYDAASAATWG
jgi:hypothetical protein